MKWPRDYVWLAALAALAGYFVFLRPQQKRPDVKETMAFLEAQRAEIEKTRAEREARIAEFDAKIARQRTDHTLFRLRIVGEAYRDLLRFAKRPPQAADFRDELGDWTSARDNQPFEVVWGLDLAKLPAGGTGMRLAWEKTAAADGSRAVLLADGKTAKVLSAAEFEKLPPAAEPKAGP